MWELEPLLHRSLSAEVERRLRTIGGADVIISPGCFPYPNSFLDLKIPVIFWSDATVAGLFEVHPAYKNVCVENKWCASHLEKLMFDGAARAVFASDWAAESASRQYHLNGLSPGKVSVVPFGANLHSAIDNEAALERVLSKRKSDSCNLLFVASQWHEKGGGFVMSILEELQRSGLMAKLTVIGCRPHDPRYQSLCDSLIVKPGFLKDNGESERAYVDLLASAHFLLHPSQGDCYGITMCEANAWAVPVLAHDTGGASTIVTNGVNGQRFPQEADPEHYAQTILNLFSDYKSYLDLCRSSWNRFNMHLNWAKSAKIMNQLIESTK